MGVLRIIMLYGAAYLLLLQPTPCINGGTGFGYTLHREAYALDSRLTRFVFGPANWLDRRVRPSYWHISAEKLLNALVDEAATKEK